MKYIKFLILKENICHNYKFCDEFTIFCKNLIYKCVRLHNEIIDHCRKTQHSMAVAVRLHS